MSIHEIDPQIIKRCQAGDRSAFEALYKSVKDDLFRLIYSLMRDFDESEEVFQECAIRLFRHIGTLSDISRFPHWVYRLVVNQCNTHRSRRKRSSYTPLDEAIEVKPEDYVFHSATPDNPRRNLMRKEMMQSINKHINSLPSKQRIAVLLFDVEGLSIKEISEHLGSSEGAIKFNIHEGRKKLRELLGPLVTNLRKIGEK